MLMHLKNMQAGMGSSPCACLFVCGTTDAYDLRCVGFAVSGLCTCGDAKQRGTVLMNTRVLSIIGQKETDRQKKEGTGFE